MEKENLNLMNVFPFGCFENEIISEDLEYSVESVENSLNYDDYLEYISNNSLIYAKLYKIINKIISQISIRNTDLRIFGANNIFNSYENMSSFVNYPFILKNNLSITSLSDAGFYCENAFTNELKLCNYPKSRLTDTDMLTSKENIELYLKENIPSYIYNSPLRDYSPIINSSYVINNMNFIEEEEKIELYDINPKYPLIATCTKNGIVNIYSYSLGLHKLGSVNIFKGIKKPKNFSEIGDVFSDCEKTGSFNGIQNVKNIEEFLMNKKTLLDVNNKGIHVKFNLNNKKEQEIKVNEEALKQLVQMGFGKEACIKALKEKKNNLQEAIEYIFANPQNNEPKVEEKTTQAKKFIGKWSCPMCTYDNDGSEKCEMCEAKIPIDIYDKFLNNYTKEVNEKKKEEKKEKEENEVNFNISDDDDILSDNSFNNNNDKLNNILNQEKENNKEDNQNNNNLKNIINTNSDKYNEDNNQNIENQKENNQIESIESNEDKSDINNQRRKNDSSLKMNSFLYESLDSSQKSSFSIEPNSLDNDKLHKLKLLLLEKNKNSENGFNDNYNIDEIYMGNSSKKSDKSLQELIKMGKNENKTLSDMMEENSYQKSPEEKNDFNNLKKTLRSQISEGKNETLKDEGIKVINETKDTKEVTDDSNTINLNTNNKSDNEKNKIGMDTNSNSDIKKGNIQNIKINNIQKKIDYEEEEKKEIKILIEESKEIAEKEPEIPKKNNKILKNYKIIERPEKLENLITEEEKQKSEEDINLIPEQKKIKIPLIKIINDSNESSTENKNSKEEMKPKNKFSNIFENPSKFTEDLVQEIVNNIIFSEIKSTKIKLLPNKKYKFEKFQKKSPNFNNNNSSQSNNSLANSCNSAGNIRDSHHSRSSLSQISLHEDLFSLNDSLNSNYSVYSVFNKTIKDKKKEHSLNLYFNKICPKLISYLHSEIIKKYPKIYSNISVEKKNDSEKLMISLVLQDAQMLRNNYRKITYKESLEKILDQKEILKNFAQINKKIRQDDNITTDNYYDNMLNECILETALELIEKERYYGETGNPLKWSYRTRDIKFKYEKNDAKKFADYICKNILKIIHNRIGLLNDNYSYLNQDEINYEREKRLLDTIKRDLNQSEYQWKNLEMEETQLKVESAEIILDQLYNEVIEILEHIQYNRISPELYQNKSIYACEEIPKLSFQQTTTEDVGMPEGEENDMLNI